MLRFLQNHGQRQRSSTENPALGGNNRIFSSITPPNLHEDTVAETVLLEHPGTVLETTPGTAQNRPRSSSSSPTPQEAVVVRQHPKKQ